MKVLVYSSHHFEKNEFLKASQKYGHTVDWLETRLNQETAALSQGYKAICLFVNDNADRKVIQILHKKGVNLILLRSAGFNHVDLEACQEHGLRVCRVPEYSPHSVAEHTLALILCLNRKLHKAIPRVRDFNFSLDHLVGFDLYGKTVGVIGTGKIGSQVCHILSGFGCKVLAYDEKPNPTLKAQEICTYVSLEDLISQSTIVTLHVPLTPKTRYLISRNNISLFKDNALLINTSRGALIETSSLIEALKHQKIGGAALDVYEEEENYFFSDHSFDVLKDDQLARLMTFPNVIITAHQAFLTREALQNIADVTFQSLTEFSKGLPLSYKIQA